MNNDIDWVFIFVIIAVVGLIGLTIFALNEDIKHKERFMRDCTQDHKQYECDAMWRAGESHTMVAPVPMIIRR